MKAEIIDRKWVVEWFDERQCYHMPSLTLADNGSLLAVWNGGFLQWNGDPMGRDAKDWVSVLEYGASEWGNPDAVGNDIRYCCHDPVFLKNKKGEIILLFAKFLDTEVNFTTWCNGRDELWTRKTKDGGRTWAEPAKPAGIQSGHASNDSVLLPDGTIVFASTSSEIPDKYFGAVRIYLSHDDGESWGNGYDFELTNGGNTLTMTTRTEPAETSVYSRTIIPDDVRNARTSRAESSLEMRRML